MVQGAFSLLAIIWLVAYCRAAAPPSSIELVYFNGGENPKNLDNSWSWKGVQVKDIPNGRLKVLPTGGDVTVIYYTASAGRRSYSSYRLTNKPVTLPIRRNSALALVCPNSQRSDGELGDAIAFYLAGMPLGVDAKLDGDICGIFQTIRAAGHDSSDDSGDFAKKAGFSPLEATGVLRRLRPRESPIADVSRNPISKHLAMACPNSNIQCSFSGVETGRTSSHSKRLGSAFPKN